MPHSRRLFKGDFLMAHSLAQNRSVACPNCEQMVEAEIWLVIDAVERPDLLADIRNGTLRIMVCSQCGFSGEVDGPLLLYRPEDDPVLIFCPPATVLLPNDKPAEEAEEVAVEQMEELLDYLAEKVGPVWQKRWIEELALIPFLMLPVTLSDDPEAAARALTEQIMAGLEKLREENPEAYEEAVGTLGEFEEMLGSDVMAPLVSPLTSVHDEFVSCGSWEESYEFVKAHPELVGEEAEDVLDAIIESAYMMEDDETADFLEEHLFLLERCREIGVQKAFAEKIGIPPDELA
ncbi:MAG TPA: hypothetical protein EYH05_03540 [Anaerolineae bacterium]|nr:hypothetical protein [Anaerolineae bacterium]